LRTVFGHFGVVRMTTSAALCIDLIDRLKI